MFSSKMKNFTINCTAGLLTDGKIEMETIDLYNYNNGVYYPDNTYYNCHPFPIEWLEIFEDKDTLR